VKVLATLSAALLSAVLVVPGGEWGGGCDGSGYADFQHRVTQRRWLRKNLRETDVRMRLGEPDCVESYGLLSFWRYPGARTIIFDASGQVIGWQNF
jgi:hypothetical protein